MEFTEDQKRRFQLLKLNPRLKVEYKKKGLDLEVIQEEPLVSV